MSRENQNSVQSKWIIVMKPQRIISQMRQHDQNKMSSRKKNKIHPKPSKIKKSRDCGYRRKKDINNNKATGQQNGQHIQQ